MHAETSAYGVDPRRLDGAAVVFTGAAGGLGRASVLALAARGARVVAVDLALPALDELASEASALAGEVIVRQADVADPAALAAAVTAAVGFFGRLDVMVNNAAVLPTVALLDITPDLFARTMAINAGGVLFGTQVAARQMLTQAPRADGERGRIVNVTSGGAHAASELSALYGATKAAVTRLTRGAATALGSEGICVCGLSPVGMDSAIHDTPADVEAPERTREAKHARTIGGRLRPPEESVDVLVWTLTTAVDRVHGKVLYTGPTIRSE